MAEKFDEVLEYAADMTTPCQKKPWTCQPRPVKAVFFDADGVLWHIKPGVIATNVRGPFKLIDENTLEAGEEPYTPTKAPSSKEKRAWKWGRKSSELTGDEEKLDQMSEELSRISEELVESLPETQRQVFFDEWMDFHEPGQPEEEGPPKKKLKWDPAVQAWYEQKQYGWIRMSWVDAPPPPKKRNEVELRIVEGKHRAAPSTLGRPALPPPPPPKPVEPRKITVTLLPTLRDTLTELKKRGIKTSVISLNAPGTVKAILKGFGLDDSFVEIRDSWENKGKVFQEMTSSLKIAPWNTLFVDDTLTHISDVSKACGLALHMGRDVQKPADILRYITEKEK